ncbi:hypothetical protein GOP47_0011559 [Adiantum capillus-veneris]|uniref:Uncharacterized protein n=1 Tax=Adiantum capillus-veneris TaxID=13818 RepID=A0A9D4UTI8_ADICA|nr:hypothetical protein GOP47_0011559 [Adiantum capillus-veneris]
MLCSSTSIARNKSRYCTQGCRWSARELKGSPLQKWQIEVFGETTRCSSPNRCMHLTEGKYFGGKGEGFNNFAVWQLACIFLLIDPADLNLSVVRKKELIDSPSGAWRQTWIAKWGHRKVVDPFIVILQRGLESKLLSLSAALGLTIGLFPVCGVTMVFCALAAVLLRSKCHVPTLMLGNFVASVFELGLLIPLMRVGEMVTGGEHFIISSSGLWEAIRGRQPPHGLVFGMLHAVIGWSLVAPFCVAVLYIVFLPIFQYLTAKFGAEKLVLQSNVEICLGNLSRIFSVSGAFIYLGSGAAVECFCLYKKQLWNQSQFGNSS